MNAGGCFDPADNFSFTKDIAGGAVVAKYDRSRHFCELDIIGDIKSEWCHMVGHTRVC